ncbi:MAG TPA: NAD(P)H-binding protein [Candidatus Acidoferrales bacterium]|nr:NAD(P)H-binding protein [Candidatus Acidoferrales bacterium]
MKVAITGGTGFVGRHLARALVTDGNEVVLVARGADRRDETVYQLPGATFVASDMSDADVLTTAFAGCDAVAHCAGINRELGGQTYERVHVVATENVCKAAVRAGVKKILLLSFLRARPNCGSKYHESKYAAEEIVRASGLDYAVFKAGVIYGRGDHMLDHLSHALYTFPVFALVGLKSQPLCPLAVQDLTLAMEAALNDERLSRKTFAITGPDEMSFAEAVLRVGEVTGKKRPIFSAPLAFHYVLAWAAEKTMKIPLTSIAQVRILSESLVEPLPACGALPADLLPATRFDAESIRRGLPGPGRFGAKDLRFYGQRGR